jgi:hypothetical protein
LHLDPESRDCLIDVFGGSVLDTSLEVAQYRAHFAMLCLNTCDLRPQAYDHLIEIIGFISQIVMLAKRHPPGEIACRDRLEGVPETHEWSRNSVGNKNRVNGKEQKSDEQGWPDPGVEGQELGCHDFLFGERKRFAFELDYEGDEEGGGKDQENGEEIEEVD